MRAVAHRIIEAVVTLSALTWVRVFIRYVLIPFFREVLMARRKHSKLGRAARAAGVNPLQVVFFIASLVLTTVYDIVAVAEDKVVTASELDNVVESFVDKLTNQLVSWGVMEE
jgi:uncharacterized membrane protein (DUF485 family)